LRGTERHDKEPTVQDLIIVWLNWAVELQPVQLPAKLRVLRELTKGLQLGSASMLHLTYVRLALSYGIEAHKKHCIFRGTDLQCPFDPMRPFNTAEHAFHPESFLNQWAFAYAGGFNKIHYAPRRLLDKIQRNLTGSPDLDARAIELGVNSDWLDSAFKACYGVAAKDLSGRLRFIAAVGKLTRGDKVESVIEELGYTRSRQTFYRAFYKYLNRSPGDTKIWAVRYRSQCLRRIEARVLGGLPLTQETRDLCRALVQKNQG
jgi:AraC-like DNA-binding protein